MKLMEVFINTPGGFHIRPCAQFAQTATAFQSFVTVSNEDGKKANGKSVLELMTLGLVKGAKMTVEVEGDDEEACYAKLAEVVGADSDNTEKTTNVFRIAFFGTKPYDKMFFDELTKETGEGTYNAEITYFESNMCLETAQLAKGYDAVCVFVNADVSAPVVKELHRGGVKLILLRCAGFNNVDLPTAKECGITVLRVPAYSPYAVAEHAMAILQQANRRLHKAYNKVKENNYALNGLLGIDLHNKVAGILGTGKIGVCMANICKGYGMKVIAWDAYPNKALEESGLLTYVSQEELFKNADLLSLHAPLFPETHHIINDESLGLMKKTAMLVNTARGGLIDNEALIRALKDGKFQAVALDVYEGEDDNVYADRSEDILAHSTTARLLNFPQVVVTSHQAFFTQEAMQAIAIVTMENAKNFAEGNDYNGAQVQ